MPDPVTRSSSGVELRQVSRPCLKCGSYYRRGTACNICGHEDHFVDANKMIDRSPMPRQYSKHGKFHTMQKIIRY